MNVAVIGGGAAGLGAAYRLAKEGHRVTVYEAEALLGGLASWFKIGGEYLEKYYHFLCTNDHEYFRIVGELGLSDALKWKTMRMGYFYNGARYNFGDPWDILLFPHLSWEEKFRFARAIHKIKKAPFEQWKTVADQRVVPWLVNTFGDNVFRIVHAPLVSGKFGEYKHNLSAAWIWARIHRVGKSRSPILSREIYGYLEGGSYRLLQALAGRVTEMNGSVQVSKPVERITVDNGRVTGVVVDGKTDKFDAVVSSIPFQFVLRMLPKADDPYFHQLDRAEYYGVTCLVLRTRNKLTPHFWLNINDPRVEIPGIIEYTNLNPLPFLNGDYLLYIPQYLDPKDARFNLSKDDLLAKYMPYLQMINPGFSAADIVESFAFKNTHAQPLCDMGFHDRIPAKRTPIRGLYLTDSYQLHPDDRTVSNSLQMGREAAEFLLQDMDRAL